MIQSVSFKSCKPILHLRTFSDSNSFMTVAPDYLFLVVQDANFTTVLELAVRFGKTLIIQEVDGVEPILYPLLRGDLMAQGEMLVDVLSELCLCLF